MAKYLLFSFLLLISCQESLEKEIVYLVIMTLIQENTNWFSMAMKGELSKTIINFILMMLKP